MNSEFLLFVIFKYFKTNDEYDFFRDKHKEKYLHSQCINEFNLEFLRKDDNVTPELMIKCCNKLLSNKQELNPFLNGMRVNICTYYSVLSDGVICIPWNYEL